MSIVIVSGLPRSGTSMMMNMLYAGGVPVLTDGVRVADAANPGGYFEYEDAKRLRSDNGWLSKSRGQAVKLVYSLLQYLPGEEDYRIVLMEREMREIVDSQAAMLANLGQTGTTVSNEQLIGIFSGQLEKTKRWLASRPNMDTLYVSYNQTVRCPEATACSVATFLDANLDTTAMANVVDRALYRQRR